MMKNQFYNPVLFKDREEAGEKLGQALRKLDLKKPVVLAIPSGGVPVAFEAARALACPLDLVLVRKIQFPWTTEAGFGAITPEGVSYLNPHAKGISEKEINLQSQKALRVVKQRQEKFLKNRKRINLKGKEVILVDDGLATGITMLAAIRTIKKKRPRKIIVASPTASEEAVNFLQKEVDQLVTLYQHPRGAPFAVAASYEKWHDLSDQEVEKYLGQVDA